MAKIDAIYVINTTKNLNYALEWNVLQKYVQHIKQIITKADSRL